MGPIVVACAITGSVPHKKYNPAVPTKPSEQIESTHAAFEAGFSPMHIHMRSDDESPSSDPDRFAEVQVGIRKHGPGMIIQSSTGGRGRDPALATNLATNMTQFGARPEIELFDLSNIHGARRSIQAGPMDERPHVQVVMGVKNALPAKEHLLDLMLGEIRRQLPKATWTAAAIGVNPARVVEWVLARGGDGVRTGLEDNVRISKDRLAASKAELVSLAAEACAKHGRRPVTAAEARPALGLHA